MWAFFLTSFSSWGLPFLLLPPSLLSQSLCVYVFVGNHLGLFESAGFTDIRRYRYWHQPSRGVDIAGMLEDLSKAPEHSVVILHACAHNPTGSDPTQEEWHKILEVVKVSSASLSKFQKTSLSPSSPLCSLSAPACCPCSAF